jgi:predicted metal-dependent peptidase
LKGDNQKIGLLKHELLHICFNHLEDRDRFDDHELHNVAADIEINQYIEPAFHPTDDILLPSSFPELNLPLKAGTRVYYDLLKQAQKNGTSPKLDALMNALKGGDGLHPTWKEFESLTDAEKKLVANQIKHQIKEIVESNKDRSRGFVPSELESFINSLFEVVPPSYDWKAYFRRFFGTSNKTYTKKTRRKLNKRFSENPALKIKTKKHVLCGIDTSGSVGDDDLVEFFNEIYHMWKTGIKITIAECDATIHRTWEYDGTMPEAVRGRGGTDMNPIIEYFNVHRHYSSLIILTDGHIGERNVRSYKPTMMVLCKAGAKVEEVKQSWGHTIKIQY